MEQLVDILSIPTRCLVRKKITKAFFKRNFELTLSEVKLLDDYSLILQMDWIASVKPGNSNILPLEEDHSVFEEVVIMSVQTGAENLDKNARKISELIHKYIPYHILLCIYNNSDFILNTCDKRVNQNDSKKRSIEKQYFTESINRYSPTEKQIPFLASLAFPGLDKQNLKSFYNAYTSRVIALQASEIIHVFSVRTMERCKQDVLHLENITRLESEILALRNLSKKEPQLNLQVEFNNQVRNKSSEIKHIKKLLEID